MLNSPVSCFSHWSKSGSNKAAARFGQDAWPTNTDCPVETMRGMLWGPLAPGGSNCSGPAAAGGGDACWASMGALCMCKDVDCNCEAVPVSGEEPPDTLPGRGSAMSTSLAPLASRRHADSDGEAADMQTCPPSSTLPVSPCEGADIMSSTEATWGQDIASLSKESWCSGSGATTFVMGMITVILRVLRADAWPSDTCRAKGTAELRQGTDASVRAFHNELPMASASCEELLGPLMLVLWS
mmetsp:Transcript_96760/g.279336  ORF Transcript_96760/g.279336 Transcript_96760/m.279336 type:complete len:241 (-) Transcript_96760:241-963(-)